MDTNELRQKIEELKVKEDNGFYCQIRNRAIADVLALIPTPPAPQETAGDAVAWQRLVTGRTEWQNILAEEVPHQIAMGYQVRPLYVHPTPAAATTDNTARDYSDLGMTPEQGAEFERMCEDHDKANAALVEDAIETYCMEQEHLDGTDTLGLKAAVRAALASRPAEATK